MHYTAPVPLSSVAPPTLTNPDAGAVGTSGAAMRADAAPVIPSPATPTTSAPGDAASQGAGTGFATDTHVHGREAAVAVPAFLPTMVTRAGVVQELTSNIGSQIAYLVPLDVLARSVTLQRLVIDLTVQSGNYDCGVYSTTDRATFTRVSSSGATAVPVTGDPTKLAVLNTVIAVGTEYYVALVFDNATAALLINRPSNMSISIGFFKAATYPLPASVTGMTAMGTNLSPAMIGQLLNGETL